MNIERKKRAVLAEFDLYCDRFYNQPAPSGQMVSFLS